MLFETACAADFFKQVSFGRVASRKTKPAYIVHIHFVKKDVPRGASLENSNSKYADRDYFSYTKASVPKAKSHGTAISVDQKPNKLVQIRIGKAHYSIVP